MENKYDNIPKEKFEFVNQNERITDVKFDTKPLSYFKDALIRFSKNKASVAAFIIIISIVLYALIIPLVTKKDLRKNSDVYYSKKGPRIASIADSTNGALWGGTKKDTMRDTKLIYEYAIGVGALHVFGVDEENTYTIQQGIESKYNPVNRITRRTVQDNTKNYRVKLDAYLEVGFVFMQVSEEEYNQMVKWQAENGLQLLYPMINTGTQINPNKNYNGWNDLNNSANYWYKAVTRNYAKATQNKYGLLCPITTGADGTKTEYVNVVGMSEKDYGSIVLEDNYLRDAEGKVRYWRPIAGSDGGYEYQIRVLYYNYYVYQNGYEPSFFLGTDSQGYDLAYRMANGLQLSLVLSIIVSIINFIVGTIYGAVEGYYGGVVDLTLERVSDILAGMPFMVVATLFQIHFAKQVGAFPSLVFAFLITGWIGTASRVRTQFYRFKNQEYVMAARTLGARDRRIIWKHIFPNTLGTIITSSVLVIPSVIFSESMLSYLGIINLGSSTRTSLGTLLSEASTIWTKYPHLMIFPAVFISLLMICFNLFGNGLRDAFNPTLRGSDE